MNSAVKIFLVSGLVLAALAGCAHNQCPPQMPAPVALAPPPPPPPPRKKVKLVLLLAERFLLPNVAIALNERLVRAEVPGVDERTIAAISMETAQGQAECAQANDECYVKVAKLLGGDLLLWAEMERVSGNKKKAPVKVVVLLFDADKGAVIGHAEETLKSDIVDDSPERLISRAIASGDLTTPLQPAPASGSPPPPSPSWPAPPSSAPPSSLAPSPSWPPQPAPPQSPPSWAPQPAQPQPAPPQPAQPQPAQPQPAQPQPAQPQPAPPQPAQPQPAPTPPFWPAPPAPAADLPSSLPPASPAQ